MKWDDQYFAINAVCMDGHTALWNACKYGRVDTVKLLLMRGADIYGGSCSYLKAPLVLMTDRSRPNPLEYRARGHSYWDGDVEFMPAWNEIRKLMCSYLALWVRLYVAGPLSSHPRRSEAIRSWGPHVASFLTGDTLPRSWLPRSY